MTKGTWEYAVARIAEAAQDATREQLALTRQVGVTITKKTPAVIADALLRVALCKQLLIPVDTAIRDHFQTLLKVDVPSAPPTAAGR